MVDKVAKIAIPKLDHLSTTIIFELRNTTVYDSRKHSIRGKIPVVDGAGTEVLTLNFESLIRGKHFSATLKLPSNKILMNVNMGTEPDDMGAAEALFSAMSSSYSMSPPPPVQLRVLGQMYGTYTVTGYMNCGYQAGARWILHDNTGEVLIPEPPHGTCCFCIPSGNQGVLAKDSILGKKEVPMTVRMGTPPVKTAMIHLVTDPKEGDMERGVATNVRQVVCELDENLPKLRKLDVICMAASLALLNVTTRLPSTGGGGP